MNSFLIFLKKFWQFAEQVKRHTTTALFLLLVFFGIMTWLIIFVATMSAASKQNNFKGGALLIEISGGLKEQSADVDSLSSLLEKLDSPSHFDLNELMATIQEAKSDPKIKGIILKSDKMSGASFCKLQLLTGALKDFKKSGKKIFAFNDIYTQEQYYLASVAEIISLNQFGMVEISGFSVYRLYFKEALEKLKINMHIFRVGTFKSALEPFFRSDMSPEDKVANEAWLNTLWENFKNDLKKNRPQLTLSDIDEYPNRSIELLEKYAGDSALLAKEIGLVDEITNDSAWQSKMIKSFGIDPTTKTYAHITYAAYRKSNQWKTMLPTLESNQIGIAVAQGNILDGKHPNSSVGGESFSQIIREARLDTNIKALVLRIDSPGGSVFASEKIRQELLEFKKTGRPIVASFSSLAASGGYWIATPADKILANPNTITGSIGIFGAIPTFENVTNHFGVYTDGVGTTQLSGAMNLTKTLDSNVEKLIQKNIEFGYDSFLNIVAKSRNMSKEDVDKIAQGRVWAGQTALEIGLIDQLGDLNDAIKEAATLAKVSTFQPIFLRKKMTESEKLFSDLSKSINAKDIASIALEKGELNKLIEQIKASLPLWLLQRNPKHIYAHALLEKTP